MSDTFSPYMPYSICATWYSSHTIYVPHCIYATPYMCRMYKIEWPMILKYHWRKSEMKFQKKKFGNLTKTTITMLKSETKTPVHINPRYWMNHSSIEWSSKTKIKMSKFEVWKKSQKSLSVMSPPHGNTSARRNQCIEWSTAQLNNHWRRRSNGSS